MIRIPKTRKFCDIYLVDLGKARAFVIICGLGILNHIPRLYKARKWSISKSSSHSLPLNKQTTSSVVPTRSKDNLGSTKVTDRSNYTLLSKDQHKDEDDDKSVDKFKTDEPVKSNPTENVIETKLVEPEEEFYKL